MNILPSEPTSICPRCKQRIESYGDMCAQIIKALCQNNDVCDLLFDEDTSGPLKTVIHFLETKGFITSTEKSRSEIHIKVASKALWNEELTGILCWCY